MELPKDLKLLIFDFDGTIFDLEIDWDTLREKLGIAGTGKTIGGLMQDYRDQKHSDMAHITNAELMAVEGKSLPKENLDLLEKLKAKYKIAVFTRNSRYAVEAVIHDTKLDGELYIVGREDVEKLKPDQEGVHKILGHFSVQASQTALVGDTYHDVEAAKGSRLVSIIVKNPKLAYSPEGADQYIDALSDLENL